MNTIHRLKDVTPYEADFARWCAEQGALLRDGKLEALDRENLAEEIETLGRSEKGEIENRLNVLLLHLLKWKYQPQQRSGSWKATIVEQRARLAKRLRENPSLKSYPAEIIEEEYAIARIKAADESRLPETSFPPACPMTISEILEFYPD